MTSSVAHEACDTLLKGANYLVRTGYSWRDVRCMSASSMRRLVDVNLEIDNPKQDSAPNGMQNADHIGPG